VSEQGVVASVWSLFLGLAFLMLGTGLLGALLGVRADLEGFPTVVIGVVMSMYFVGFLIGSLTIPRWLISVGHIRVFTGLASLAGATALLYSVLLTPVAWGLLRLVFGFALSGLYVTIGSWLNERATDGTRGRLLSVYMLVLTFGMGLGPLLLGVADPLEATLFTFVGVLIALSVVPVALVRIPEPTRAIPVDLSIAALARSSPLGVLAVATAGAAGGSVLALGAVYATKTGMEPGIVGVFMVASLVGAALSQYPLGSLSDRFPRRRVVLGAAMGAVAIATAAAVLRPTGVALLLIVAAYGSLAFPMYSLAVSMVNDSMPTQKLVAVAAGVVFVYGVGSVIGPIVISVLMEVLGPVGYFWGLAGFFVPVVGYALARILFTARPRQGKFVSLPFRSSTALAMLADRSDGNGRSTDSGSRTSPLRHGRR